MSSSVFEKEHVFFVQDAVTFETVTRAQKEILHLIHKNALLTAYAIDFKGVTAVNSAALGLLVELKKYTLALKKEIQFVNLPERLLSLAQVCGVADWLKLSCS